MDGSAHPQSSEAGTTRSFISHAHPSGVLQGFNQLRREGLLCDATLVPGDGEEGFPVHRAMMAVASDYFKDRFSGETKEQDLISIKLPGVSKTGLKKIIDFIYTAELSLDMDNFQATSEAASFLRISPVLDFCKAFLTSGVPSGNWAEVERAAKAYNLAQGDQCVNSFILQNFPALLKSGEFVELPFERLAFVLSSDRLKHCTEMELFRAACRWLQAEEPRMKHAAALMKHIRFPLMTPQDLLNHVQTVDFMRTDSACVNFLLEANNYHMMLYMQPFLQSERTAIRSDSIGLVTVGGLLKNSEVSKKLRRCDEEAHKWWSPEPMDAPVYQQGIAVVGNFLYVAGGFEASGERGHGAAKTVLRFDPRHDTWLQVASLNEKRADFHLGALKGHLYAVGGQNEGGCLATVECYNPRRNKWSYVARMDEPLIGHAGAVYGGLMYISGGFRKWACQKELVCFDPDVNQWTQRAPMTAARAFHCICAIGDKLYVMGGISDGRTRHDDDNCGSSDNDVLSCECYSPTLDQWTPIAAMLHSQRDAGVVAFENRIYVVGGRSWKNRQAVGMVQKYDPEKDEWHKVCDLPESLRSIRACTLTVSPPEDNPGSPSTEFLPLAP